MWYKCKNKNCGFVFESGEPCEYCPDCGKPALTEATEQEIAEKKKIK